MAEAVIRVEKLVHVYPRGNVKALKGIDLDINKGDVVSIVGQNGSGKTTLVRHFNGLLRPTEGKVYLMGEDSTGKYPKRIGGCLRTQHDGRKSGLYVSISGRTDCGFS